LIQINASLNQQIIDDVYQTIAKGAAVMAETSKLGDFSAKAASGNI
jgi:hypothetical protein